MGSDTQERAEALDHVVRIDGDLRDDTYLWLQKELPPETRTTGAYRMMRYAVTNLDYLEFMLRTGQPQPYVDEHMWTRMNTGLPYKDVEKVLWQDGRPSPEQLRKPVVLVDHSQAERYCRWWGNQRNATGSLPSEAQWERAARGDKGARYPWGNQYEPALLNASDLNLGEITSVAAQDGGVSPHGVVGMAGNVFEWTSTRDEENTYIVKGGAYMVSGAFVRPAARHARPGGQRHIALGFRCTLTSDDLRNRKANPQTTTVAQR